MEKMRRTNKRRKPLPPTNPPRLPQKKPQPPVPTNSTANDFFNFDAPEPPRRGPEMRRMELPAEMVGATASTAERRTARPRQSRRYRITTREMQRRRRKRVLVLLLFLVVAILVGIILSINVLFKVKTFRIEGMDKTVPADTGVYTEEQILSALDIQADSNMFSFNPKSSTERLLKALPYLDNAVVLRSLPDTVVVRVEPAVERYSVKTQQGWATLSTGFRVLSMTDGRSANLIFLRADNVQAGAIGEEIQIMSTAVIQTEQGAAEASSSAVPTPQPQVSDTFTDLMELANYLETEGLLDRVTQVDVRDTSEITVTYDARITVNVGTANNLPYKMQIAGYILRNENGDTLSDTDKGSLDVSHVKADGTIDAVFSPK